MDSVRQVETDLLPIEQVSESFFKKGWYDNRFTSSDYYLFTSNQAIENIPIVYTLPALKGNKVYRLDQAALCLRFKMVKGNGSVLDASSQTVPINGILNSIWEKSLIELNGVPVNSSTYLIFAIFMCIYYSLIISEFLLQMLNTTITNTFSKL